MQLIIMETTNQQSLYCVIGQRIIGDFIKYPEYKEFLIRADYPIKVCDLIDAVKEYMAIKNQININLVSIYDMVDISKPEDKERWYKTVESRQWCFEYHSGKLYQTFL